MSTENTSTSSDAVAKAPPVPAVTRAQPRRSANATVQYMTVNQGAYNERLFVVHQFKKPGNYSYTTAIPKHETAPKMTPGDQGCLNRGITRAMQMFRNPIIIPPQENDVTPQALLPQLPEADK